MNLTRQNFFQKLPFIQQKLRQAEFVAIDFEFSGLLSSPLLRNSMLDSVCTFLSALAIIALLEAKGKREALYAAPARALHLPEGIEGVLGFPFQLLYLPDSH